MCPEPCPPQVACIGSVEQHASDRTATVAKPSIDRSDFIAAAP
jgi:hypothetical protein